MTIALLDHVDLAVPGGPVGETWLRLFRPAEADGPLPVVVYVRDGAQPIGDARIRRMAARLTAGLSVAVIAVDYSLCPRALYPVALEELYAAVEWAAHKGGDYGLDHRRIAVASDPLAADLATRLVATVLERGGPPLAAHVPAGPRMRASLRTALDLDRPALPQAA